MYIRDEARSLKRLEEAEKASRRAKDLVDKLSAFTKGSSPLLLKKRVSMVQLLQDSCSIIMTNPNIVCEFSYPEDLWPVEVDEVQMNQVINNLLINAEEAMPEGGKIRISLENLVISEGDREATLLPNGRYIKITIKDQGIGIPPEHLPRIFEPYFTTKQRGSGLGLTTSYTIIKHHQGHLGVDSEEGKGSSFYIYLPAANDP